MIAYLIGYPIAYPIPNLIGLAIGYLIGFLSPEPVPDSDKRKFRVKCGSTSLRNVDTSISNRSVSNARAARRLALEC